MKLEVFSVQSKFVISHSSSFFMVVVVVRNDDDEANFPNCIFKYIFLLSVFIQIHFYLFLIFTSI